MEPSLDTIPLEILERIGLFVGWDQLNGPPKDLASLCLTSKAIHDSLSFSCNPSLYASLFRYKFDIAAPLRRLSSEHTTVECLASEFRARFTAMRRIRRGIGSHASLPETANREPDLWMAVIMMLENDGKNSMQLRTFGNVQEWLHTYFLEPSGGSYIQHDMQVRNWPRDNTGNKLALWLLCLLDADGTSLIPPCKLYTDILRSYAIGANRYPLTDHSWTQFSLPDSTPLGTVYRHFNRQLHPTPPATAVSAVLGYIARIEQPATLTLVVTETPSGPDEYALLQNAWNWGSINGSFSQRWDCVWARCIGPGLGASYVDLANGLPRYYRPGSLEGSWEGLFTYAEFGVYAAMLSGEPPQLVTEGTIGHNDQVWKVREYNLYSLTPSTSPVHDPVLSAGSAHNAFFPTSTVVEENDHYAVFTHSSQRMIYHRPRQATGGTIYPNPLDLKTSDHACHGTLRDVIIIGEGHSSWGSFRLRGRVRPSDAFVTVLKEYNGSEDRGSWLYRGYLVGERYVGRWRDVLTPVSMTGYEGGFELKQRQT